MALVASQLRPGHPDFLDLPWDLPLDQWEGRCARVERLPRGEARHPIVFVDYDGRLYALKGMEAGHAEREYALLRTMEERALPVVSAVGHCVVDLGADEQSVLITRYLDHSLPYHTLFTTSDLARYRDHLLDALASLLVQLHLAGVFWGDCSLFNTLFLRDAGTLQAVLVDAETSEVHAALSDQLRQADLDLMEENVAGGLLDLVAVGVLAADYPALALAADVRRRYDALWSEVRRVETITPAERWRITERIRALNALGFSVGEIMLTPLPGGDDHVTVRVAVTDRSHHRRLLHALTGLETQELQARQLINEIHELRLAMGQERNRSLSLGAAAYRWLEERYRPAIAELAKAVPGVEAPELYCQLLEHKWLMSEQAARDVGHASALADLLARRAGTSGASDDRADRTAASDAADDDGSGQPSASAGEPTASAVAGRLRRPSDLDHS
ncbi:MAG: DUF4032 domain-containing protein [Myxococcota bacterium]